MAFSASSETHGDCESEEHPHAPCRVGHPLPDLPPALLTDGSLDYYTEVCVSWCCVLVGPSERTFFLGDLA